MANIVKQKSFAFAIQIIEIYKFLIRDKNEFVLSKQLLKSGTAIGALIMEAEKAESKKDFIHKMSISLKEANESSYWIELLFHTHYINHLQQEELLSECEQLIKLLVSIIKKCKMNL